MKRKKQSLFLAFAGLLVATTEATAAETITVCAMNPENTTTTFGLAVLIDGAEVEVESDELEDGCFRINLVSCDKSVVLRALGDWVYKETEAECTTDPTPVVLAMEYRELDVIAAAFPSDELLPSDLRGEIGAVVSAAGPVFASISPEAEQAAAQMMAAISRNDYATAQFYANESSAYLRSAGRNDLSVAFSSLTYVTGLRAIGVDPFNPDNPLVSQSDGNVPAMLVLNSEGQNLLGAYVAAAEIKPEDNVAAVAKYDFGTAKGIKNTAKASSVRATTAAPKPIRVPAGGWRNIGIGSGGMLQLR